MQKTVSARKKPSAKNRATLAPRQAPRALTWFPAVCQLKPLSRRPQRTATPVARFDLVAIVLPHGPVMCRHWGTEHSRRQRWRQPLSGRAPPRSEVVLTRTPADDNPPHLLTALWPQRRGSRETSRRTHVGLPDSLLPEKKGPRPTSPSLCLNSSGRQPCVALTAVQHQARVRPGRTPSPQA